MAFRGIASCFCNIFDCVTFTLSGAQEGEDFNWRRKNVYNTRIYQAAGVEGQVAHQDLDPRVDLKLES